MRDAVKEMFRNEPLMAEPVFQSTYGWETTEDDTWRNYFLPRVIERLGIGANYPPYTHQASSWKTLLDRNETKSIVVTSGTGSGKTECFLYPVMNDIIRDVQEDIDNEIDPNAVRAIFLYPLNALMADQCRRIKRMCDQFEGVKFAIYNGNTPDNLSNNNGTDSQLQSRDEIRNTPPQILLSNPSMLEYILVRGKDYHPENERKQDEVEGNARPEQQPAFLYDRKYHDCNKSQGNEPFHSLELLRTIEHPETFP